jgi:hypothetical protein
MAIAAYEQTPRSFVESRNAFPAPEQAEFAAHVRTYRSFVHGVILFVVHAGVILALLAYFLG